MGALGWPANVHAQTPVGTAFTYQGQLTDASLPANGAYDFEFKLFDVLTAGAPIASTVVNDLTVAAGLFTTKLDFGATSFTGSARFLEIGVRPGASTGAYTLLGARQELTPAPNAIFSQGAPWAGISGKPAGFADGVDDAGITAVTASAPLA